MAAFVDASNLANNILDLDLIKNDTEREMKEPVQQLKDKRVHLWTSVMTDLKNAASV